ncbi:MAG: FAD:protein FMN transferase [Chloroflexi bacterium]|nr:FAD:protein FMN transferase [Chloroflexota bacterium]
MGVTARYPHPVVATFVCFASPIVLGATDPRALAPALAHVQERFAVVDATLSRFRADSELRMLEERGAGEQRVSPLFFHVLQLALRYAAATDGWFDPTVRDAVEAAGYDRDIVTIEAHGPGPARSDVCHADWRSIHLDQERGTVRVPEGTRLDFGGIGKGFAVDYALRDTPLGEGGVLLSAGGDLAVKGPAPAAGWTCDIAVDAQAPVEASVALFRGALATSGLGRRQWRRGGESFHHLIDPHTGKPAQTPWRYVTVAAHTCVAAEVAAKVAFLRGSTGPAWISTFGLAARFAPHDGSALVTGPWPEERKGM